MKKPDHIRINKRLNQTWIYTFILGIILFALSLVLLIMGGLIGLLFTFLSIFLLYYSRQYKRKLGSVIVYGLDYDSEKKEIIINGNQDSVTTPLENLHKIEDVPLMYSFRYVFQVRISFYENIKYGRSILVAHYYGNSELVDKFGQLSSNFENLKKQKIANRVRKK